MAEVVYRGGNHPVRVGASIVPYLVQSWQINDTRNPQKEYMLGQEAAIGTSMDAWRYRGQMTVHPVDTQVERALIAEGTATSPVTLVDLLEATALALYGPNESLGGAVVESLRYTANAPSGIYMASYSFRGSSRGAGASITAASAPSQINFLPKNIMVQFGTLGSNLLRVRRMEIALNIRTEEAFEFSNEDPWYLDRKEPACTVTLGWFMSRDDTSPGTLAYDYRPAPDEDDPDDLEIQLVPNGGDWDDAGNIKITLANIVSTDIRNSVNVNALGEDESSYTADDSTTGGFQIEVIAP